jgi:GTPase SAR1 family protein
MSDSQSRAIAEDLASGSLMLGKLIDELPSDFVEANEAETRHQFIDRLIHGCLGWRYEETHVERQFGGEYSDYELGVPPLVVLEAKRAGKYFRIPNEDSRSGVVRSIRSLCAASSDFKSAIEQAQRYCSDRGIQIGAVSNGYQLVIFIGVRSDGVPPLEGKCLLFNGLHSLRENFSRCWDAISPAACRKGALVKDLMSAVPVGVPPKLASSLRGYPSFRYPSESQQSLRTLSDLLIEDAPNTPALRRKFYEECYCESGALAQEALVGKSILAARYAAMFNPASEGPVLQAIRKAESDQYGISSEAVAEALGRRPIVIIGDVGVGKTSFIRNLIFVKAAEEMKNAIFIYLDLGNQANLGQDLRAFFVDEVERQLLEDHGVDLYEDMFVRGVYHGDLIRFEKGIYGRFKEAAPEKFLEHQIEHLSGLTANRIAHLQRCIQHLSKGRRKQVVISIDNADQRKLEDQQAAFLAAQEFAAQWHALVLVSLRPKTYFISKFSGSVSAYPQRILTISPPRVDLVLQRRLRFSLDLAEGRLPLDRLEGISIKLDSIALFLKALIESLRNNHEIVELLSNITGGNIREALELIKGFIGSANVDSDKIIRMMREGARYQIPLHEFSKQALLGEYSHYEAKSSLAYNLFDIRYPDAKEHFLACFVLGFLSNDSLLRTPEGFLQTSDIIAEFQRYGYVPDQIEHCLRRLTNKKLIETTERITFDEGLQGLVGDMPLAFRITTAGAYHIERWVSNFAYIDAMLFDTPILAAPVRTKCLGRLDSFDIRDRLDRSMAFVGYLDECWRGIQAPPIYFDWMFAKDVGKASFESVRRAVDSSGRARQK